MDRATAPCGCHSCRKQPPPALITMERGPDGVWHRPSPWDVLPPFQFAEPRTSQPAWLYDYMFGMRVVTAPFVIVTGI